MKTRALAIKLAAVPSMATVAGPVFRMLDAPGVVDAHGDTMDAGALELPPAGENGFSEVPLYWLHSYHEGVVAEADPADRIAIGVAMVWMENGEPLFTPRFFGNTELSEETQRELEAGEISACSVGYLTVEATPNGKGPQGTGEDVHRARLGEVSLVDKGAKASAVRIKTMTKEELEKLQKTLAQVSAKVARLETKSFGVEMMCGSGAMYFCTEMMEHLAETVAACQTYVAQENPDPGMATLARGLADSAGKALTEMATWLSSPAARGESAPAPAGGTANPSTASDQEPPATDGTPVAKWWQRVAQKPAA